MAGATKAAGQVDESGPKSCFIIAPIGTDSSDIRKRSNQIQKHVIDPVVIPLGFARSTRADTISDGGLITQQIINHIAQADLVVADLTGANPNVYYELALRHGMAKPFVQMIVGEERLPFDVANQRTIFFDHHDLDSVEKAKQDLEATVRSLMLPDAVIETPLTFALDLTTLRQSDNPEERGQADIIEMLQDLRSLALRASRPGPSPEVLLDELFIMRAVIEDMVSSGHATLAQLTPLFGSRRPDTSRWVESLLRNDGAVFYSPSGKKYRAPGDPVHIGAAADEGLSQMEAANRAAALRAEGVASRERKRNDGSNP